jgi:dimethylargininase
VPLAITREVSSTIGRCELTHLPRAAIDYALACAQHRAYAQALAALGCEVIALPARSDLPDSVFVEDTAVVLDELAVITRPGAESRRAEAALAAEALRPHRTLATIEPPGTLDGGDVLRTGRTLWVGLSTRSNADGLAQLRAATAPHGYRVRPLAVRGCLHLKSAATEVAPGALLVNPDWVDERFFAGLDLFHVDPTVPAGANALRVGGGLIYPASFPRTRASLEARGLVIKTVDLSELQKAEGAVTCCSLILRSPGEVD